MLKKKIELFGLFLIPLIVVNIIVYYTRIYLEGDLVNGKEELIFINCIGMLLNIVGCVFVYKNDK